MLHSRSRKYESLMQRSKLNTLYRNFRTQHSTQALPIAATHIEKTARQWHAFRVGWVPLKIIAMEIIGYPCYQSGWFNNSNCHVKCPIWIVSNEGDSGSTHICCYRKLSSISSFIEIVNTISKIF